jgi:hypothetical protein
MMVLIELMETAGTSVPTSMLSPPGGSALKWPTRSQTLKEGVSSTLSCGENFEDLRLADWNTKENWGFADCTLAQRKN